MKSITNFCLAVAGLTALASTAVAEPVTLQFDGLRSANGNLSVSICQADEYDNASQNQEGCRITHVIDNIASPMTAITIDLPAGEYAGLFLHDENANGQADFVGPLPTEGVGFTNNPSLIFGIPGFNKVKTTVNGPTTWTLKLNYLL